MEQAQLDRRSTLVSVYQEGARERYMYSKRSSVIPLRYLPKG